MLEPRDGLTPELAKAFSCKTGQPTVKENLCRIW
jgi:hypothetical protein